MDAIHYANNLYWKQGRSQTGKREPNIRADKSDSRKFGASSRNCDPLLNLRLTN